MTQLHTSSGIWASTIVGIAALTTALAAGCSGGDDVDPNTGGSGGSPAAGSGGSGAPVAGSGGTGGSSTPNAGSGGSSTPNAGSGGTSAGSGGTTAGSGGMGAQGTACPPPGGALMTDFTYLPTATDPTSASFGDFTTMFSGGTYVFPNGVEPFPLTSDVSKDEWVIAGEVGNYSGFGIFFNACHSLDASTYKGISFKISGDVPSPPSITDPPQHVTFTVGTAENDVTAEWINAHKVNEADVDIVNLGRCTPVPGVIPNDRYNGSCAAPKVSIPVTATPTTITVLWEELLAGRPAATVDPSEITSIAWALPPPTGLQPPGTVVPYMAEITIDDLTFVE